MTVTKKIRVIDLTLSVFVAFWAALATGFIPSFLQRQALATYGQTCLGPKVACPASLGACTGCRTTSTAGTCGPWGIYCWGGASCLGGKTPNNAPCGCGAAGGC